MAAALGVIGWIVAMAAIAWIALKQPAATKDAPFHAAIVPEGLRSGSNINSGAITLSPDGSRLVFRHEKDFGLGIYDFETGTTTELEGTRGGTFQFWSPDGRWIGFFQNEKLVKIPAEGGAVQVLTDAHDGRGATWSPEGVIVFAPDIQGPLMKVSDNGGTAEPVTTTPNADVTHRNPSFLPDGRHFLFVARDSSGEAVGRTFVGSIEAMEPRLVMDRGSNTFYSQGYLVFTRDGNLLTQAFDLDAMTVSGPIVPLAEKIDYWNPKDLGDFSVSPSGLLAYRQATTRLVQVAWFSAEGRELETVGEPMTAQAGAASRDLRRVVVSRPDPSGTTQDVWILETGTSQITRATFVNAQASIVGTLSPDGNQMVVGTVSKTGGWNSSAVWIQPASGSRTDEVLIEGSSFFPTQWSPDGRTILGTSQLPETGFDITYVDLENKGHEVRNLVATRFNESQPTFSPDGRRVLYRSQESGQMEIYVVDFPDARSKWQVSRNGGSDPHWSVDGREIYYSSSDGFMSVTVTLQPDFQVGTPVPIELPRDKLNALLGGDGRRFLVVKNMSDTTSNPIRIVRNWTSALR